MAKKAQKGKPAKKAAKPVKKAVAKKPAKKTAPKKVAKPVKKAVAKKPVKKIVAKKVTPKKAIAKKPLKKVAAKKAAPKKPIKPVKKIVAKKATPKKVIAKKPVKKVVAKKTAPKKLAKPVNKIVVKKVAKPTKKIVAKAVSKKAPVKVAKTVIKKIITSKPVVVAKPIVPVAKKFAPIVKKKQREMDLDDDGRGGKDEAPMIVEYKTPSIRKPMGPAPKPHINTDTRTRYSDAELKEFKELILKKLAEAQKDYELLKSTLSHKDDHGTDDTSPTFKLLEDGSDVLSKEETAHLAGRQEKFIQNLQNALIRIENKTYGICRATGKLISKERLKSVPHATLAIEAKLEQNA
jgi:RNA polymerase-binding transcription factor DksA